VVRQCSVSAYSTFPTGKGLGDRTIYTSRLYSKRCSLIYFSLLQPSTQSVNHQFCYLAYHTAVVTHLDQTFLIVRLVCSIIRLIPIIVAPYDLVHMQALAYTCLCITPPLPHATTWVLSPTHSSHTNVSHVAPIDKLPLRPVSIHCCGISLLAPLSEAVQMWLVHM
jgi:hypothetical protein